MIEAGDDISNKAIQCDIYAPEGVTMGSKTTCKLGENVSATMSAFNNRTDGALRAAMVGTTVSKGTTTLFTFTVTPDESFTEGTFKVTGIKCVEGSQPDFTFKATATATGISEVKKACSYNAATYNLAGQRVSTTTSGIVIIDGKKHAVK